MCDILQSLYVIKYIKIKQNVNGSTARFLGRPPRFWMSNFNDVLLYEISTR